MIYSKLSLRTGGGIVSELQQAEQVKNTATLLIGLGGTGIDCLKEIKKQMRVSIKPDNPGAEVPVYEHIRFLAVDNERIEEDFFEKEEIFELSSTTIWDGFSKKEFVEKHKELDWMDLDKVSVSPNEWKDEHNPALAFTFRQAGRYRIMEHSDELLEKIRKLIQYAKTGIEQAAVNVHVFSGLGGTIGSGTFLDACYLIRHALKEETEDGRLFGYFFLPDVILAKIPRSATMASYLVTVNSYASLQELDYCMRIRENGGAFTQNYKGGVQIAWNEPPVDYCCLIGETKEWDLHNQNIYWKTIGCVADYIVDDLIYNGDCRYGFRYYWNSISAEKEIGCNVDYYTIGDISSAKIPFCEINTYLAAKTFEAFSVIKNHKPTENEITKLTEKAKVSNISDLLIEIMKNGGSGNDLTFPPDDLDWIFTRDNGDHDLVNWYTEQKEECIRIQEKNAESMMDEKNADSLIVRICEEIDACAADLNRGPAYAYDIMRVAYKGGLQNRVDGLLEDLKNRISLLECNVYTQAESRRAIYEQSRHSWEVEKNKIALFGKPRRAYNIYVLDLEDYVRGQIELNGTKKLKAVLENLKKQIDHRSTDYYQIFREIMNNLMDTFRENLAILNIDIKYTHAYAMPLVTIEEIRPILDTAVKNMDMTELFKKFVYGFFCDPEKWIDEDENKISQKVKKFFVKDAFSQFANRSITGFLADKYGTTANGIIMGHLYSDYMIKLIEDSKPLFALDENIWSKEMMEGGIEHISVPIAEPAILGAAQSAGRNYSIPLKNIDYADRIYMMQRFKGFPISAYKNIKKYEKAYFEDGLTYRHLYIGKGGSELFSDWSLLPSIIPMSCMEGDIPYRLQKMLDEAKTIYTEAKEMQLIYGDRIRQFTSNTVQKLEEMKVLAENVNVEGKEKTKAVSILRDVKEKLEASIEMEQLKYQDTEYSLPKGSIATEKIEETIREDYFVSSPALQNLVKRELEKVNAVKAEIQRIEKRIELLEDDEKRNFSQALLAGIIQWDRLKVSCTKTEYGIPIEIVLSDFMDNEYFPYAIVPLYQAYVSYTKLDTDTRETIQKETEMKIGAFDDDFVENIKKYAEKITPEYMDKFIMSAEAIPEILEEARELVQSLNQELSSLYQAVKKRRRKV